MGKIELHKSKKFRVACQDKVYKFQCDEDFLAQEWVEALKDVVKMAKQNNTKVIDTQIEIKLKKKVILDYYNLLDIHKEVLNTKTRIEEQMKSENYFEKKDGKKSKRPNRKIIEKSCITQDKLKLDVSSNRDTNLSSLNVSLIDNKTRENSFFSCCLNLFKKK
jgi:hypothetical protein